MLSRLLHFLSRAVFGRSGSHANFRKHRQQAQQSRQLRAMSDLELRDLGIGRGEIPALMQSEPPKDTENCWGNRHSL